MQRCLAVSESLRLSIEMLAAHPDAVGLSKDLQSSGYSRSTFRSLATALLLDESLLECAYRYALLTASISEPRTESTQAMVSPWLRSTISDAVAQISNATLQMLELINFHIASSTRSGPGEAQRPGSGITALSLLWPLGVIAHCPFLPDKLFEQCDQALDFIVEERGIKRAATLQNYWRIYRVSILETNHWSRMLLQLVA